MSSAEIFDLAAAEYEQQLNQGIHLSGESADYFVQGRVGYLRSLLQWQAEGEILDFGCGIGNAASCLQTEFETDNIVGYDCSRESVALAQKRFPDLSWTADPRELGNSQFDLAYTSGVFHHIDPAARDEEIQRVFDSLRPGGHFALFENNPWNPGTVWVMSRIPFDRDAIRLSIPETQGRLRRCGFDIKATRSLFYFPKLLRFARPAERMLAFLPFGAQYLVLAQKPR